jgi:hypothetical protein
MIEVAIVLSGLAVALNAFLLGWMLRGIIERPKQPIGKRPRGDAE